MWRFLIICCCLFGWLFVCFSSEFSIWRLISDLFDKKLVNVRSACIASVNSQQQLTLWNIVVEVLAEYWLCQTVRHMHFIVCYKANLTPPNTPLAVFTFFWNKVCLWKELDRHLKAQRERERERERERVKQKSCLFCLFCEYPFPSIVILTAF